MGANTRILVLSNRDPQTSVDEPPLEPRGQRSFADIPADSGAPVAASILEALGSLPGVRVALRTVFLPSEILAAIGDHKPDVVVNLCEALGGDSRLEVHAAWLLGRLGLPFTGSPFTALRHCLYKLEANQLLARAGVRVPATVRVDSPDHLPKVPFPVIVKPEREDGSLGIDSTSVVYDERGLRERVAEVVTTYKQPAIVQRYIHGREIGISLLGWPTPRVLPPGELTFHGLPEGHPHILTFDSKWNPESPAYRDIQAVPAVLRPHELRRIAAAGRRAFEVLGLRDYGRVDVRLDERGEPHVIDVNPNCDLSDDGGFAKACARAGMGYPELLWQIVRSALGRKRESCTPLASRGRSIRRFTPPSYAAAPAAALP